MRIKFEINKAQYIYVPPFRNYRITKSISLNHIYKRYLNEKLYKLLFSN